MSGGWRRLRADDLPGVEAFLAEHIQSSIFTLVNLRDHGLDGTDARAVALWGCDGADGPAGVLAVTREGMLLPQIPVRNAALARALGGALAGRPLVGAIGDADQVRCLLLALGLDRAPTRIDADDPAFRLDLDALALPPGPEVALEPAGTGNSEVLARFRSAYHREVLGTPAADADAAARADVARFLTGDSYRLLHRGGRALGMTGINATWGDTVQVGGVYVRPEERGRGIARRAVGLHLAEVRAAGARRAILFASGDAAARAYRALGFEPAGTIAMVLFDGPQRVPE
ncbi:GNAT family N-acetyltransferase [Rhodobacteraceae bacterium CCMM004]|nr:GNAT family N-acetyltransferase [Rhodobacteraceae bacterium CCMM004]